ncbi:hypothetical protein, partial [Pseudomonas juntendi]|uniref:hypothetical protein n=1 Tax=Pseudomonas juntendi TaxID=2666183 RepID=UPI003B43C809
MEKSLRLWERPCVAKGPRSGPGISCGEAKIFGAAAQPFRDTQGRSHKVDCPQEVGHQSNFLGCPYEQVLRPIQAYRRS